MFDPYEDYGLQSPYALVIDTDRYAWNFEREMCAWMTGYVGEHYPGSAVDIAEIANNEIPKEIRWEICDIFGGVNHDEYGQMEVIMTNKEGQSGFKSVAIMFNEKPSDKALATLIERAKSFPEAKFQNWLDGYSKFYDADKIEEVRNNKLQILGIRFETYEVTVNKSEEVLL
jgi:hypothetical protein